MVLKNILRLAVQSVLEIPGLWEPVSLWVSVWGGEALPPSQGVGLLLLDTQEWGGS